MPEPHVGAASPSRRTQDTVWIERMIHRAHAQLAIAPIDPADVRETTLARLGDLEVSLTELPDIDACDAPAFRLELRSEPSGAIIDSIECTGFDDAAMSAAVDFVRGVVHRLKP